MAAVKLTTYILHQVPIKDIVVGESLSVEEISDKLTKIGIVWLLLESQGPHVVVVGCKLR